jgi:hypothetical protein
MPSEREILSDGGKKTREKLLSSGWALYTEKVTAKKLESSIVYCNSSTKLR